MNKKLLTISILLIVILLSYSNIALADGLRANSDYYGSFVTNYTIPSKTVRGVYHSAYPIEIETRYRLTYNPNTGEILSATITGYDILNDRYWDRGISEINSLSELSSTINIVNGGYGAFISSRLVIDITRWVSVGIQSDYDSEYVNISKTVSPSLYSIGVDK